MAVGSAMVSFGPSFLAGVVLLRAVSAKKLSAEGLPPPLLCRARCPRVVLAEGFRLHQESPKSTELAKSYGL